MFYKGKDQFTSTVLPHLIMKLIFIGKWKNSYLYLKKLFLFFLMQTIILLIFCQTVTLWICMSVMEDEVISICNIRRATRTWFQVTIRQVLCNIPKMVTIPNLEYREVFHMRDSYLKREKISLYQYSSFIRSH